MSFVTERSSFYYGFTITSLNNALDFNEGASELQATLNPGDYSLEELLAEIKRAMEVVGANTYTISVTRSTRIINIDANGGTLSLLAATGTRIGTGVWTLIGFSAVDKTGSSDYDGDSAAGEEFRPQSIIFDYIDPSENVRKQDATVHTAANGDVQVVLFGTVEFIEMNIRLQTDRTIAACQPEIEQDLSGVQNLKDFMDFAITKGRIEFMLDRTNANSFKKCVLESTRASRQGTGYKLIRMEGSKEYFETERLVFRVLP